jgi:hypothetical protein
MKEYILTKNNWLTAIDKLISATITPFTIPFETFLILFLFSYLHIMPWQYKITMLGVIFCSTIILPAFLVYCFQKTCYSNHKELSERKKHYLLFFPTIISYLFCFCMMLQMNAPRYLTAIILASLFITIALFCFNLKWKLSIHMAGIGEIIGELILLSVLFGYNPLAWLCFFILASGFLGTWGIISRHHSLAEILAGFTVGFVLSLLVLYPANPLTNILFWLVY